MILEQIGRTRPRQNIGPGWTLAPPDTLRVSGVRLHTGKRGPQGPR